MELMSLVLHILYQIYMQLLTGGWGGLAASHPICEESTMSMGYRPRTERSVTRQRGEGRGYVQKPPCSRAYAANHKSPLKGLMLHRVPNTPELYSLPEAGLAIVS